MISLGKPQEILYRMIYGINSPLTCPVCGDFLPFSRFALGYPMVCSNECKKSQICIEMIKNKTKEANKEKYGVE